MSNTQTFIILPCPHTGLRRWLTVDTRTMDWREHRADNPGASRVVDLYEASHLRQEFGD